MILTASIPIYPRRGKSDRSSPLGTGGGAAQSRGNAGPVSEDRLSRSARLRCRHAGSQGVNRLVHCLVALLRLGALMRAFTVRQSCPTCDTSRLILWER